MLRDSFLHHLFGKKKNASCRNQTGSKRKSFQLEALEDRHMLSVTFELPPTENTYIADSSSTVVNPDLISHNKVFSADLNLNDDKNAVSLIVLDKNNSKVSTYVNNGTTNAFSSEPVSFTPSDGLRLLISAAVGELTGDGNTDLIMGYPEDNILNFSVYRGEGNGGFFPTPINTTITGLKNILLDRGFTIPDEGDIHVLSMDITLVDNNLDGKLDMICAVNFAIVKGGTQFESTGSINLLLTNDGTGKFNPQPTVLATSGDILAAGDLGGADTKPEYVVKNEQNLTIYLNGGTQSTIQTPNYSWPIDQVFVAQCYRDGSANNGIDGKMEIITTHTNTEDNSYYLCVTTVGTSSATIVSYNKLDIVPYNVVTGDFNNDGYIDIFVSDGNVYQTLLGQSNKTFVPETAIIANGDFETSYVADFDGDGIVDVLAIGQRFAWLVPGDTSKAPTTVCDFTKEGITPKDIAFGDFNADGKMDFAVLSFNGDEVFVFSNTSTSSKVSFSRNSILTVFGGKQLLVANFDNAHGDDIVVYGLDSASATKPTLQTFLSAGSSFNSNVKTTPLTTDLNDPTKTLFFDLLTVGEVTNDGYVDIVGIINGSANKVQSAYHVMTNMSSDTGRFTVGNRTTFENPTTNPTAVAIGDLTGDGRNDLVILDAYGKQILMLPQSATTSGSFRPGEGYIVRTTITTATVDIAAFSQLVIADFNADGALDVLVGTVINGSNTQFRVLENDPTKLGTMKSDTNFTTVGSFAGATASGLSIHVGLLDNNGTPDVVIVGGNTIKRFVNTNKTGAEIGTVTLVFRSYSGAIVNTEVADLSTLANRLTYIDEWSNFWVEIWANTGSTAGISQFTTTLTFNANVFEVRSGDVVAGAGFTINQTNTSVAGQITLSGTVKTSAGTQGDNTNTMLARVSFMPVDGAKVGSTETAGLLLDFSNNSNYVAPTSNGFGINRTTSNLNLTSNLSGRPTVEFQNNIPLFPVMLDVNDDGFIDARDFTLFARVYSMGSIYASNAPIYIRLLDCYRDSYIDARDFTIFALNYQVSREICRQNPTAAIRNASNFPNAFLDGWQPSSPMQTSSLSVAIEEMSEIQTAMSANSTNVQNQALMAYMASQDTKKDDFDINDLNPVSETARLLAEGKL